MFAKLGEFIAIAGIIIGSVIVATIAILLSSIKPAIPGLLILIVGLLLSNGFITVVGYVFIAGALLIGLLKFAGAVAAQNAKKRGIHLPR